MEEEEGVLGVDRTPGPPAMRSIGGSLLCDDEVGSDPPPVGKSIGFVRRNAPSSPNVPSWSNNKHPEELDANLCVAAVEVMLRPERLSRGTFPRASRNDEGA